MKREEKKRRVKIFFAGFKNFVSRGNVIDLAVAVIIGAAFGKITTSLVNDIIMPPIGLLINGVDFKDLVWVIKAAEIDAITNEVIKAAIQIRYGVFLMTIIEFLIIAFSIYASLNLVIRRREFVEKVKAEMEAENEAKLAEEEQEDKPEEEPVEEVIPEDILLLREIRDSLKEKN